MCNSDDLKTKQTDFNNIWQLIVDEISILEKDGIDVVGRNIKGTLVQTAFDNLGANQSLGFSGSFSASKFCRHCVSSKEQCQKYTSESQCILLTVEKYDQSLEIVAESETVNLDKTDGVKFFCVLSNLLYYHIIKNPTADKMHDVFEGCITLLLTCFFLLCFELKIFSKDQLDNWIKCYDFGVLNNANVPSEINFDKRSLGQNASQALCLFKHLPFILNKFRDHPKLQEAWKCIETLLQICEIISSYEITELELDRLQKVITLHLELFQKCFKHPFIPKQHFLLHYASIMRAVGPLIYFSMMRFDAKHKIFKNMRHATNNFISINKTLAYEHQKQMCMHGFGYKDNFNHGVLKLIEDESILALLGDADFLTVNSVAYITRYLHFNEYKYLRVCL